MKTKFMSATFLRLMVILIITTSCTSNEETETPSNNLNELQGNWFRVGGNNPNNNGMKINVDNDQGILVEPSLSGFQVDDVKWSNIFRANDTEFDYLELGSDYNYYNSIMELGSDDTLRINVANSGVGNIQKWVRTYIDPTLPEQHDCLEYDGNGFSDESMGNWEDFIEFDTYPSLLMSPSGPGGGYFRFSVSTQLVPYLSITSSSDSSGAIFAGSSAGTTNENNNQFAFLAHPSKSYDIKVYPFLGDATFPLDYLMNWSFIPAEDCYEPNDIKEEAKSVPKDETHQAYGIAGHITNYVSSGDENTYDWYKITNQTEGKIKFTLENCPSDLWVSCTLVREDGTHIGGQYTTISGNASGNQAGSTYYYLSSGIMPSGTYYIRLQMSGTTKVDLNTESIPQYWSSPYNFKIETIQ